MSESDRRIAEAKHRATNTLKQYSGMAAGSRMIVENIGTYATALLEERIAALERDLRRLGDQQQSETALERWGATILRAEGVLRQLEDAAQGRIVTNVFGAASEPSRKESPNPSPPRSGVRVKVTAQARDAIRWPISPMGAVNVAARYMAVEVDSQSVMEAFNADAAHCQGIPVVDFTAFRAALSRLGLTLTDAPETDDAE